MNTRVQRTTPAYLLSVLLLAACDGDSVQPRAGCNNDDVCGAQCNVDPDCGVGMMCGPTGCELAPISAVCVDGDSACGAACDNNADCGLGMYCGEQGCSKNCVPDRLRCENLGTCTEQGECMSTNADPEDTIIQDPDGSDGTVPIDTSVCASTVVSARPVQPNVILIVDQSGSMNDNFMRGTRWEVLRDFLLQQGGLIDDLQDKVRFGLAMYSARHLPQDDKKPDGECPLVTTVTPSLDNYQAISDAYLGGEGENEVLPIEDTPTGDAIDKLIDDLGIGQMGPDTEVDPTIFVLATDGEPDTCEQLNPQDGQVEAIEAVQRAHGLGVQTFVISVGRDVSQDHLQDVANAGLGRPLDDDDDDDAQFWVAGNADSLAEALTDIVGGTLSCEIALDGKIAGGDACEGTVRLNGEDLSCGDENGWELMDQQRIRLVGTACETLKAGGDVRLEARFPCGVSILQ